MKVNKKKGIIYLWEWRKLAENTSDEIEKEEYNASSKLFSFIQSNRQRD